MKQIFSILYYAAAFWFCLLAFLLFGMGLVYIGDRFGDGWFMGILVSIASLIFGACVTAEKEMYK